MSSSTEQKIEKSLSKGFGKLKKNFRPGGSKSDNLEEARKKADDETFRADTLFAATKTIETTIIKLAEKWKPRVSGFHMEVDQSRRQYGKEPELLPIILVNTLIKFYEKQWVLTKLSEKWDRALWQELERLMFKMHNEDTEDTKRAIHDYRIQIGEQRKKEAEDLGGLADRFNEQSNVMEELEAENSKLQKQLQHYKTERENEIAQINQEHANHIAEVISEAQAKVKTDLIEQGKLHKIDLAEQARVHRTEMEIAREEYISSKSDLQDQFHRDKLDMQSVYQKNLDKEVRDLRDKHQISINSQINQYKLLQGELEEARQNVQDKIDQAKAGFAEEERKLKADMENRNKTFKEHLAVMERNADVEKRQISVELNGVISDLKFQISDIKEYHIGQMRQVELRHIEVRKNLEEAQIEQIQKQQEDHEFAISELQDRHAEREQEMEARYQKLQKEAKTETTNLRAKINRMEEEFLTEKKNLIAAHDREKDEVEYQVTAELKRLKSEYSKKNAELTAKHDAANAQLRGDVEAYSAALLARDDFKPMPDHEIKTKFAELAEEVKTLGRLEWKDDQKVWTNRVIDRLSTDNTSINILKRKILQETIWIILHKHIFCSPFRPFGEEGQIMETKWNDAYGTDPRFENGCYTWPMPEMEGERWRYVNVKECRNALRQAVDSEWDPRAKLKIGFQETLKDIREEFTSTVGEMVVLAEVNVRAMDKIAKKAANVWLEFGMQRCRIVMVFGASSLKLAQDRIRKAREGKIELVVIPELKRYGNSKGLELHTEATVSGCGGEKISVSMR